MSRPQKGEPEHRPNASISELWEQYTQLKAARDELYANAKATEMSELQHIMFESEKLEPIVRQMDVIAMRIAQAKGEWRDEIRIKAEVLLDYVDTADGDVAELLAISLSRAVLAMSGGPN